MSNLAQYDTFNSILQRREWDAEFYLPVYEKCFTPTKLHGDEYRIAQSLAEAGLMQMTFTPIWSNGRYHGKAVTFTSVHPSK